MSSTNKTNYLGLNKWVGSDIPKMSDFNNDNAVIDAAVEAHESNAVVHITDEERSRWDSMMYMTSYFGNGSSSRSFTGMCPFKPRLVIVFASGSSLIQPDYDDKQMYTLFGWASAIGSTPGLSLTNDGTLIVMQATQASEDGVYYCMNRSGTGYNVMFFR